VIRNDKDKLKRCCEKWKIQIYSTYLYYISIYPLTPVLCSKWKGPLSHLVLKLQCNIVAYVRNTVQIIKNFSFPDNLCEEIKPM
jgi:hypothetical protein